ncbi:sigma-70 family RNA polymerase sigma factor [Ilyomonas limi]|uniref:Sigma-70 family RNA polymerase sigma factor n=1 Tax=Ilyomonas limi TaxID=2575867 RepID=A0A4U3LB16_9BACT|nr:sigma-70 family RNA polymerase sigma factor [Ilyomonas limi]TKK70997.1 sigma-70 family RNA polymerase sigma factor [Ilyomonas limi]
MIVYQQLSEIEIIDNVIGGDIALFEVLIRRYNPYLYKVGRSYGYIHQDVEDLMQETFISAFENLGKLHNKTYFKTWLIRIMLNECYRKSYKAAARKEVMADTFVYEKSTPMFSDNGNDDTEKTVGNRELSSIIENAIRQIPMDYRMVFSLRELNGMSVHETAMALNITETNVKVRLNRAKAMLRKEVEKMYSAEEIFEFNLIYCDKIVENVMARVIKSQKVQNEF